MSRCLLHKGSVHQQIVSAIGSIHQEMFNKHTAMVLAVHSLLAKGSDKT